MISVQNHLPLLSGSKILLFVIILLSFNACSTSKKTPKKQVQVVQGKDNPKTTPKNTSPVDTVSWTKKNNVPPITNVKQVDHTTDPVTDNLSNEVYDVSLFIPFKANAYTNEVDNDERFVQYYAGIKLAAEELETENIRLNINVVDSEQSSSLTSQVKSGTDLIIGPYDEQKLRSMIDYGKQNQIPVVSPWYSLSKVEENPYYIQLRPTIKEHFVSIVKNISENFQAKDVVLVGRDNKTDHSWFKFLQGAAQAYYNTKDQKVFIEHFVLDDSLANGQYVFTELINSGKKVFIVPNYSFKDENYIYSVLRRINAEKYFNDVVVYGLPIMLESDRIDFDFYNSLNMRLVVSEFVDEKDNRVASFGRKFFDTYGTIPEKDAYEAHDMLLFIGRAISKYGKNFQNKLALDQTQYLQTSYDIQPVYQDDSFSKINFYENKKLSIIRFKGGKFVRM